MRQALAAAAMMIGDLSSFGDLPGYHHPVTSIPVNHEAEAERIRAAEERRKRKAARQAKGFRP